MPAEAVFQFPGGLADHLAEQVGEPRMRHRASSSPGSQDFPTTKRRAEGRVEWAVAWPLWSDGSYSWYCNTVPTPDGGTHEQGLRAALTKGIRAFGELVGQKKAKDITADDVMTGSEIMLSVFIREPQFQSQTKDRLTQPRGRAAGRERGARPLRSLPHRQYGARPARCSATVIERMDERLQRKAEREVKRKTATNATKLRLPGKLTDCSGEDPGEHRAVHRRRRSAPAARAKQARDRKTQAILPIRGKILNVATATADKIRANQEIADLNLALGCGTRKDCDPDNLRYERIVIMTDADVDGAHIATLLMTFFFQEMPDAGAARASLPRPAAALPPDRRQGERSTPATTRTAPSSRHGSSRARRSKSAASRASAR